MSSFHFKTTAILLLSLAVSLGAKDKHPKNAANVEQDQIEVVARLPLSNGPVTRFLETQHYRRDYLYAEHQSGKQVTLIDVTSVKQPVALADVPLPPGASSNLVAVTGNAALVANNATAQPGAISDTFRIMSFADPLHPVVTREIKGVTAISSDDKRGLIFLANNEGIWILQQKYALSPEDEKFQKELEHTIYDAR